MATDTEKTPKVSSARFMVTLTDPAVLRRLAHCNRLYSEIHSIVSPSTPIVIKAAIEAFEPILEKQLTILKAIVPNG